MNKVVKCKNDKCGQHFMHTEKNTKCPFCHTEYGEAEEKPTVEEKSVNEEKPKARKVAVKTQKDSFKIWRNS
ncbi:MAG: hypothetical protein A3I19_01035 [Candidatus Zambryskibacteria bacterium RIFCSPLOWO2_02_FULL_38_13]|nr:MAG: hypothetical protein A3I19_01035 [Candidatus Zambryskibacteria bacterium RIFCSPLOWO2_02_FULL_38_13]